MIFPLRALKLYSPLQILNGRIIIAFFMVWAIILLFKKQTLKNNLLVLKSLTAHKRNKILLLILLSGVFITLNWLAFIYVINHISLKAGAFAYLLCPLITALLGTILLKETLSKIKYIALGLALVSIMGLATGAVSEIMCRLVVFHQVCKLKSYSKNFFSPKSSKKKFWK